MIQKPKGIWKGIPSNYKEFFREVFVLYLLTATIFGLFIAFFINIIIEIFI